MTSSRALEDTAATKIKAVYRKVSSRARAVRPHLSTTSVAISAAPREPTPVQTAEPAVLLRMPAEASAAILSTQCRAYLTYFHRCTAPMLSFSCAVRRARQPEMACAVVPAKLSSTVSAAHLGTWRVMASAVWERVPRMVFVSSLLRMLSARLWVFWQAVLASIRVLTARAVRRRDAASIRQSEERWIL